MDDRKKVGKPDRIRVNVSEPYEVRDWCAHWGCTESELRHAVKSVGVMVTDVEAYLRRSGQVRK